MPRPTEATPMTSSDYLRLEEKAEVKHEFVDGFMFAMAGAGDAHNLITLNIGTLLRSAARGTSCRAYVSDMKLAVSEVYYYPNVLVTCDEADLGSNIKRRPCLVFEVLSESTSDIDRGEKLLNYRKLSSLQAYVLVSQTKRLVEVYRLVDDGSWRHDILEAGALELPCLPVTLSFDDVYEDVDVTP